MSEILWITGQRGSGKTTLAKKILRDGEIHLDGDVLRPFWADLEIPITLSKEDRWKQGLRTAILAKFLADQGINVVVSVIAPYVELRREIKKITNCLFIYITHNDYPNDPEHPYEEAFLEATFIIDRREDVDKWRAIRNQS